MGKKIISQGTTTNEAIEKGLKELHLSKDQVDIKVLEEEKKSFFSILDPRVVRVEIIEKEKNADKKEKIEKKFDEKKERHVVELSEQEQNKAEKNIKDFLNEIIPNFEGETEYKINKSKERIEVSINNKNLGFLIGYRGETLYAFQEILSSIANRGIEKKVRIILDIEDYKNKRKLTLEELAQKVAKTVIRTGKNVKLEPMKAYERKIIHTKLQENYKIETKSIGEEPYRRIVVSLKK